MPDYDSAGGSTGGSLEDLMQGSANSANVTLTVHLDKEKYSFGENAILSVDSSTNEPFDLVIGNGFWEVLYHYDGQRFPISYSFPLSQLSGKHYATVTQYSSSSLEPIAAKTVEFEVNSKELKRADIQGDPALASVASLRRRISSTAPDLKISIIEPATGRELQEDESLLSASELSIVIRKPAAAQSESEGLATGMPGEDNLGATAEIEGIEITIGGIDPVLVSGAGNVEVLPVNENTRQLIEKKGAGIKKGIELSGLETLVKSDYSGTVVIDTTGIDFNTVYHCSPTACVAVGSCDGISTLEKAELACYSQSIGEPNKISIYVPHFSSIILALDNTTATISIASPDNSTPLQSGEDIYLNLSVDEEVSAYYILDGMEPVVLDGIYEGGGSNFSGLLEGSLPYSILANGNHMLQIFVEDMLGNNNSANYSFEVADNYPPSITLATGLGSQLNNSIINKATNELNLTITSDEYALLNLTFNGDKQEYGDMDSRTAGFELILVEGQNVLLLELSDYHSNFVAHQLVFSLNSTMPNSSNSTPPIVPGGNCSDGLQNSHDGQDETGIDCGGACPACVQFSIATDKPVYNQTEQVEITVNSRQGSNVSITISGGTTSYSTTALSFPAYYIFTDTANIGTYSIQGSMKYLSHQESLTTLFNVVSNQPQNPLGLSISTNRSTIWLGETIRFNAIVTGNSTSVSYNWDFNGDKVTDSTSSSLDYAYPSNGSYEVNLTITSGQWSTSATKSINVKKTFNVTFHVTANSSSVPVDFASVNIGDYSGLTDVNGYVTITVPRDTYSTVVTKSGYLSYYSSLDVNANMQVEVTLGMNDIYPPSIALNSPASGKVLPMGDVEVEFTANDGSMMNCSVFTNTGNSWWALEAVVQDVEPGEKANAILSNLEPGIEYSWRVQCRDARGNTNFSQISYFTLNESLADNSALLAFDLDVQEQNNDLFMQELSNAIAGVDSYARQEQEVAEAIGFKKKLSSIGTEIERLNRDLYDLRWRRLNGTDLEQETSRILDRLQVLKEDSPKSLQVLETQEFVKYPGVDDIYALVLEQMQLEDTKKNRKKIASLVEEINDLQNSVTVTTKGRVYDVESFSGKRTRYTVIIKEVKAVGELGNVEYFEIIPKELAGSIDEVDILFEHQVVEEDPIIKTKISGTSKFVYILEGSSDLKQLEQSKSILMPSKLEAKPSGSLLTGFAVSGIMDSDLFKMADQRLLIEIAIIVVLLGVYLAYSFDDLKNMPIVAGLFQTKEYQQLMGRMQSMQSKLEQENYDAAKTAYSEISSLYRSIKPKEKKELYAQLVALHNKLDVLFIANMIAAARNKLRKGNIGEASEDYQAISTVYKKISKEYKAEVLEECSQLHNEISEAS